MKAQILHIEPAAGDPALSQTGTAPSEPQNVEAVVIPDYDAANTATTGDGKTAQ